MRNDQSWLKYLLCFLDADLSWVFGLVVLFNKNLRTPSCGGMSRLPISVSWPIERKIERDNEGAIPHKT